MVLARCFGVLIVVGVLWLVAWLILSRDAPEQQTAESVADDPKAAAALPVQAPLRVLLTTGSVIGIGFLTFFAYWSTTLKVSWLPLYLNQGLGYDTITAGWLIMLPYAVAAAARSAPDCSRTGLTARGVSRRIARGYLAGGLVVLAGLSMYLFTTIGQGAHADAFITLAFSMNTAAYAIAFTAIGDVVHPKQRGMVLGCLVAFYSLAGVIAPCCSDTSSAERPTKPTGYGQGFSLTGIIMAVGGVLALFLVRPERDLAKIRERVEVSL